MESTAQRLDMYTECNRDGVITYSGYIGDYRVRITPDGVSIGGASLNKFYLGDNYSRMGRRDIKNAITKLSDIVHLPIDKAKITRLDIGDCLIMKEPPKNYYKYMGALRYTTRLEEPTSICYQSNDNSNRLVFYDKNRETTDTRGKIPEMYKGSNVLRYEQRYTAAIAKQLGETAITASMLYNERFYISLLENWKCSYMQIEKLRIPKPNIKDVCTVSRLKLAGIIAFVEQFGGIDKYFEYLKEAQRNNIISAKQASDQRKAIAEAYNVQWDSARCDGSDMIEELTDKVKQAVMYYR